MPSEVGLDPIGKIIGLDAYERAARLYPAFLAIAPASATSVLWAPDASALVRGAIGVVVTGGLTLLLMRFGRARGRAVQDRMVERDGGLASTLALRHRDRTVASASKERYHAFLRSNGLVIPERADEDADPAAADDQYRSAADWLRSQTRDIKMFPLLHAENRDYGFRRNLLGLKPLGLSLTLLSLIADVILLLATSQRGTQWIAGTILAGTLIAASLMWIFMVTTPFVADASRSYTEQLLACCDLLGGSPPRARTRRKTSPTKRKP